MERFSYGTIMEWFCNAFFCNFSVKWINVKRIWNESVTFVKWNEFVTHFFAISVSETDKSFQILERILKSNKTEKTFRFSFHFWNE
jgi:hypothetical protein